MLSTHQTEVITAGVNKITHGAKRLLIKGSAGVGKTYAANQLIKMFLPLLRGSQVLVTAPTHKALHVLTGKVDPHDKIEFSTLHSALKLKRKIDYKTGAISFKPDFDPRYPPLKGVGLLIADEASMISKELLAYLEEYATNCIVIFLGDDKQINPVNEDNSPVFEANYPEVELTEIIRQGAGNPIIDLSRDLMLLGGKVDRLVETDYDEVKGSLYNGYLFSNDLEKSLNSLAAVNGTDEIKYLAWTNKEVNNVNFMVRKKIYGQPNKIEEGETLVFDAPYREKFHTNQEIFVQNLEVSTVKMKYVHTNHGNTVDVRDIELKVYCINPGCLTGNNSLPPGVVVIHEDSQDTFKKLVNFMKKQCKSFLLQWRDYYHFLDQFAELKYNHAITVHKSQGSTYEKSIVNVGNICLNRNALEKQRLLYTAVTRASDLLILYNA